MHELYKKYRPRKLSAVLGQLEAVKMLEKMCANNRIPHCILLSGPSGTGKTTIARILKRRLKCSDMDFREINTADFRGIEMVRDIRSKMGLSPMGGKSRIWLLDEVHQINKYGQEALLKMLEDTPKHVYFFLATTEPETLVSTLRNRATPVVLKPLSADVLERLVVDVLEREKAGISEEVMERLINCAEGSARWALVLLGQVLELDSEEEQLNILVSASGQKEGIEIARGLLNPRARWVDMQKVLASVKEEPEKIRWIVLGYMSSVLMGKSSKMMPRANMIIECFRDNWYDCKKAGLVSSCYNVICSKG